MAKWFKFSKDMDYRWPESGAVTAFKEGMVVFIKDEVFEQAVEKKAGKETDRPEGDDGTATASSQESAPAKRKASNPVSKNAPKKPVQSVTAPVIPGAVVMNEGVDIIPAADAIDSGGE